MQAVLTDLRLLTSSASVKQRPYRHPSRYKFEPSARLTLKAAADKHPNLNPDEVLAQDVQSMLVASAYHAAAAAELPETAPGLRVPGLGSIILKAGDLRQLKALRLLVRRHT